MPPTHGGPLPRPHPDPGADRQVQPQTGGRQRSDQGSGDDHLYHEPGPVEGGGGEGVHIAPEVGGQWWHDVA